MKSILVTGGAGFIGSYLCEVLLKEGNQVVCLDDFSTGSKNNIKHLLSHNNFKVIEQDICTPPARPPPLDQIYHLASPASPVYFLSHPIKTLQTNVLGTLNVLELAREQKARVIFASTSEVYGNPEIHPQKENYVGHVNPVGPRACYDEGKRAGEALMMDFHRMYGVEAGIVRLFNTYGPRMAPNDGRVVGRFISAAQKGLPLEIFGDGEQTRSFCFVSDIIGGLTSMMDMGGFKGPVNLGNPEEITVNNLAKLILELTGSTSEISHLKEREDEPRKRKPDISLATEKLNWTPSVSLKEGLEKMIAGLKRQGD